MAGIKPPYSSDDLKVIRSLDEAWACTICGFHPDNGPMWCAAGCGRDYNSMKRIRGERT